MSLSNTKNVIRGGRVLDIALKDAPLLDVLIDGDTIIEIGAPGMPVPESARVIPAQDRLIIPGLINAHTHAHGALAKGMVGDRWPLELFLNSAGSLSGDRTLEDKYLTALLSAAEMVRKGCTASYDLFVEFPAPSFDGISAVAQAYLDVGMRAVIAPMMADRTLYQAFPGLIDTLPAAMKRQIEDIRTAPYEASLATCRKLLENWNYDRDRIRPALAPTIPLHCSDEFLIGCRDLAAEFDVSIQTHLAESRTQAVAGVGRYGMSLTAYLNQLGLIGPRFSAAHAIWLDTEDISLLADNGATIAHNVLSNMRLGSGIAPVHEMRKKGVPVGIGTDASNTSDTQNMFESMRLAAYISRVRANDPESWLVPEDTFSMATEGSARVLGFENSIGRIASGYKADIVFLHTGNINFVPLNNPLRQIVNTENGMSIDRVMIGGEIVLENDRLLTIDETKLRRDVEAAVERLNTGNDANRKFAEKVGVYVESFCATHRNSRAKNVPDYVGMTSTSSE